MARKRSEGTGKPPQRDQPRREVPAGPGAAEFGAALLVVDGGGSVTRAEGWEKMAGSEPPERIPPAGESPDALVDAVAGTLEQARRRGGRARRHVEVTTDQRRTYLLSSAPWAPAGGGEMAVLAFDITEAFHAGPKEGEEIRDLGHDLRTPLTSLSGAVELLQSGRMGALTAGQDKLLGMMQQGLTLMLTLIEEATAPYRAGAAQGDTGHGGGGHGRAAAS